MYLQQYFGTLNNFSLKRFNYKVVDPIEDYNLDIKFVFIRKTHLVLDDAEAKIIDTKLAF